MSGSELVAAVERWKAVVARTTDADMERAWSWRGVEADVRWAYFRTYEDLVALADAIAALRLAAGRPTTLAQRALARYHATYRELLALLARVTAEDFDRAPAAGEWPLREVMGHIMRADAGFLTVTTWALDRQRAGDDRPLAAPESLFGPRPEADATGTMAAVLARFAALHERVLGSLCGTTDAELHAPVGFWYTADVGFQLYRFDAHLREHTIQAEKVVAAILPPPSDAWRMLRLFYRAAGGVEGATFGAEDLAAAQLPAAAAAIRGRADELATLLETAD